jgi:adenylate cyclase
MSDETNRYGVVWHDDRRGKWYSIVDRKSGEHIAAYRSRTAAHRCAADKNLTKATPHHAA